LKKYRRSRVMKAEYTWAIVVLTGLAALGFFGVGMWYHAAEGYLLSLGLAWAFVGWLLYYFG